VKCRVFVDFDGTIAPIDTTDLLLEHFAAPMPVAASMVPSTDKPCVVNHLDEGAEAKGRL
jgi:hypothetical protein